MSPAGMALERRRAWRRLLRWHWASVVVSLSLASCGAGGAPSVSFVRLYRTRHVDYDVEAGVAPPCAALADRIDGLLAAYARLFGLAALPDGARLRYALHADAASVARTGCAGTDCQGGGEIHAIHALDRHELVHAAAELAAVLPPPFLTEGLAEVLGCDPLLLGDVALSPAGGDAPLERLTTAAAWRAWIDGQGFGVYRDAGAFTRFLADRFGLTRVVALGRALPFDAGEAAIAATFARELGAELPALFAAWRQTPPAADDDRCLHAVECGGEATVIAEGRSALLAPDCSFAGASPVAHALAQVAHAGDGALSLEVRADAAPASIVLRRCAGGAVTAAAVDLHLLSRAPDGGGDAPGTRLIADAPAGDYLAVLRAPAGAAVTVAASPVRPALADASCGVPGFDLPLTPDLGLVLARRGAAEACAGLPWCAGVRLTARLPLATNGLLAVDDLFATAAGQPLSPDVIYGCAGRCPFDAAAGCTAEGRQSQVRAVHRQALPAGTAASIAGGPPATPPFYLLGVQLAPVPST